MVLNSSGGIYKRVIIITILLIISNQIFIQYWLHQKKNDAEIINLAGRQRMISQRLVNLTLANRHDNLKVTETQIQDLYDNWATVHSFLIGEHKSRFLSLSSTKDIQNELIQLTPLVQQSQKYIDLTFDQDDSVFYDLFRSHQDLFLEKMNGIVYKIELQSEWKLNLVRWIEILFALFSLAMVYYEIRYVFMSISKDLSSQNQKLKDSNQMLEQYAFSVAHDLRSPIQNIINFSKIIRERCFDNFGNDEKEYMQYIIESADRMQDTTASLLRFSTISQEELVIQKCDIEHILKNVKIDLNTIVNAKDAVIEIRKIPASIYADKNLLHNVLLNLMSNSVKYIGDNVVPKITLRHESNEVEHTFIVEDNGIGIKKEDQEKIFNMFKRLHGQNTYQGTGIGLSICKKIVEKHGGRLSVKSTPGIGSEFSFTISKNLSMKK